MEAASLDIYTMGLAGTRTVQPSFRDNRLPHLIMVTHLHKHIRKATRKAFERYGFAYADVLAHWREIVGAETAEFCAPERIRWPRMNAESAASGRRRLGGTLVIRVTDGRAVELQHETSRIIDRVNTYYGYGAITGITLVQGPLPARTPAAAKRRPLDAVQENELKQTVGLIENEELRQALTRLGRGALAQKTAKQDG